MIWNILTTLFASWAAEVGALTWLGLALVAGILEISVPHFGCAFISAGAVVAAAAAFLGFSVPVQRTDPLIGRHGQVTHDIDPVLGTGRVVVSGEDWAARSSEAIATGTRVRVVGADGIVLEVTRA